MVCCDAFWLARPGNGVGGKPAMGVKAVRNDADVKCVCACVCVLEVICVGKDQVGMSQPPSCDLIAMAVQSPRRSRACVCV